MNDRYGALFARLGEKKEGAFGAFVMLGDPDLETCAKILDALVEAGADMLEVGIPFSDPVADGPTIQAAADRALGQGVNPAACFELLKAFRARHAHVPVGILTYANIVIARGKAAFYRAAAEAGVDSVLVADVPAFEAEPFVAAASAEGVAPILIAAPNTSNGWLMEIAELGQGYTYVIGRAGVTGAERQVEMQHEDVLACLAELGAPPPVLGFGISKPEHVRMALDGGAKGVISGSAIVSLIAKNPGREAEAVAEFVREMKASTRG